MEKACFDISVFILYIAVLVFVVTRAVAVVIFVPPEAPTTILTLWCLSNIIVGHIDERGLFPGQKTKVAC